MTKTISLDDAQTNLSSLVEEAAGGAEIVIAKNGKARARLVALQEAPRIERQFGLYAGRIAFMEDLDAPWPEEIRRAWDGDNPIEPDEAPASGQSPAHLVRRGQQADVGLGP